MAYPNDEWQRKGATLSDKTARQELQNAASGQSPAPTCQGGDSGPSASHSRAQRLARVDRGLNPAGRSTRA